MGLHFQLIGDRTKPALILLHGFLGSGSDWLEIAHRLSAEYCCLLPDLPGHGHSRINRSESVVDFESTATALIELQDQVGIGNAALIGYSLGGRVALYTAVHFPGRVTALVLESANPGIAEPIERAARAAQDDQLAAKLENIGLESFLDEWYSTPLFASLQRQPERFALLRQSRLSNVPQELASCLRGLSVGRQTSLWNYLAGLRMPLQIVTGALDIKYSEIGVKIRQLTPRAQHAKVPNAGHNVHFEQPQEFLARLQDFLHDILG